MTPWKKFIAWIDTILEEYEHGDYAEPATPLFITKPSNKITMTPTEEKIYQVVKDNLGVHLTLNENVSPEVGCAECMSKIMQLSGIAIPSHGIAGTAALLAWFESNPDFVEKSEPEQGAFVVFATGTGNGKVEGHTGAFCAFGAMYTDDWGIASNDSTTGTMREQWSWKKMLAYYRDFGGIQPRIFAAL